MLRTAPSRVLRSLPKTSSVPIVLSARYVDAQCSNYSTRRTTREPRVARTSSKPIAVHPHRVRHRARQELKTTEDPAEVENTASTSAVPTDPSLTAEVVVPEDLQNVLQPSDDDFAGATKLLSQSALVVTREIEMMNIFLGFEQANKYSLHAPSGELVGYLAEEEQGMLGGALQRQLLRTHRPFKATVMDTSGKPILMIRRPLTWINSKSSMYAVRASFPAGQGSPQDQDLELIGEVHQRWHLYKRRYELFLRRTDEQGETSFDQFAQIDAGLWSWNFMMQDSDSRLVGAIDRNFRGFGREIFTDTGQYVLRFDSVGESVTTQPLLSESADKKTQEQSKDSIAQGMELVQSHGTRPLTLDERAVALATAVAIDFDYFSRHSEGLSGGAGGMFPWFYMGGMGGGGGGGEVAETPGGTSQDGGFGAGAAGGAVGSGVDYPYGASESGSSDDGRFGQPPSQADNYPSTNQEGGESPWWNGEQQQQQEGDVWGSGNSDPWAGAGDTQQEEPGMFSGWGSGGDGGGGGGGGGWGLGDFFDE